MIAAVKPPEKYRLAWSKDPAIKLPEDDVEAGKALKIARETGDWSKLLPDSKQQPTWFIMRWLPEMPYRRWWDLRRERGGPVGIDEALALLFKMALVEIEGGGDLRVRLADDDRVRDRVATDQILDDLKAALGRSEATLLVAEIAACVFEREEFTAPKS